ncbi:MAG: hypothetical protein V3W44_10880 [Dehalococcoidales bacterium]
MSEKQTVDRYRWEQTGLHKVTGDQFGAATHCDVVTYADYEKLRDERDLLLAYYNSYSRDICDHHCKCLEAGCDPCEAAHAYQEWQDTQIANKEQDSA